MQLQVPGVGQAKGRDSLQQPQWDHGLTYHNQETEYTQADPQAKGQHQLSLHHSKVKVTHTARMLILQPRGNTSVYVQTWSSSTDVTTTSTGTEVSGSGRGVSLPIMGTWGESHSCCWPVLCLAGQCLASARQASWPTRFAILANENETEGDEVSRAQCSGHRPLFLLVPQPGIPLMVCLALVLTSLPQLQGTESCAPQLQRAVGTQGPPNDSQCGHVF